MPFQSKNTTNNTVIFERLVHDFFLVEETLSPSEATIGSWFQHHTHKPSLISCYDVLKKVFIAIYIGKQFLTDFNTVSFLIITLPTRYEFCTDATHLKFFSKNLMARSYVDAQFISNFLGS